MRKFWGLIRNEWFKFIHSLSMWIILGLLGLTLILTTAYAQLTRSNDSEQYSFNEAQARETLESLQAQRADTQALVDQLEQSLKSQTASTSEAQAETSNHKDLGIREELSQARQNLKRIQYAEQLQKDYFAHQINPYEPWYALTEDWLHDHETHWNGLPELPQDVLAQIREHLSEGPLDYLRSYRDWVKTQSDDWAQKRLDSLDIIFEQLENKPDFQKGSPAQLKEALSAIEADRTFLAQGYMEEPYDALDSSLSAGPLTPNRRAKVEQALAFKQLKLQKGGYTLTNQQNAFKNLYEGLSSKSVIFITIILILLAGASISQELSTGTIKSLIISPSKRQKIYWAKFVSLLLYAISLLLIATLVGLLISVIFTGYHPFPIVISFFGKPMSLPFLGFVFADCFIKLFPITAYLILAYALSATTRNTAVSVALPLVAYFFASFAVLFFVGSILSPVSLVLPYMHLNFDALFFGYGYENLYNLLNVSIHAPHLLMPYRISPLWSLLYYGGLAFSLLMMGRDAFCRRDI